MKRVRPPTTPSPPARTSPSDRAPENERDRTPAAPRPLVLYVEDDEANRQVAVYRLEKRYELLCAKNDREACLLLQQRGTELAIILMDIELKGAALNGVELTRVIRGRRDRADLPPYAQGVPVLTTPILFVTAYGDRYRTPELLRAGGDEVIAKPVDFVALHTAMARVYLHRMT
jgi:CheY-like chemotaxis protein